MNVNTQEAFSRSTGDTKTGGMRVVIEDNPRVSKGGDSSGHWSKANRKKFNEDQYKGLKKCTWDYL